MARRASRAGFALALAAALAAAWLAYFMLLPVVLPQAPYEFTVHAGTSLRGVARHLAADGVLPEGESLWIVGRALGKDRSIQAGVDILRRAHGIMRKRLADAWASRTPEMPLRTPYEALVLASIVEKETGLAEERPLVAAVFLNRLKRGMRLQTDPTVIYGMGEN